jgi:hypothetical protein
MVVILTEQARVRQAPAEPQRSQRGSARRDASFCRLVISPIRGSLAASDADDDIREGQA